jgi:hypothetical protein
MYQGECLEVLRAATGTDPTDNTPACFPGDDGRGTVCMNAGGGSR